jgi:hypothetical protein
MMEKREDPFGGWDTPLLSFYGFYFLRQGISALPQTHRHVTIDFSSFSWQKPLCLFESEPSFLPSDSQKGAEAQHPIQAQQIPNRKKNRWTGNKMNSLFSRD